MEKENDDIYIFQSQKKILICISIRIIIDPHLDCYCRF